MNKTTTELNGAVTSHRRSGKVLASQPAIAKLIGDIAEFFGFHVVHEVADWTLFVSDDGDEHVIGWHNASCLADDRIGFDLASEELLEELGLIQED